MESRALGSPIAYVYDAVRFAGLFRFALDDSRLRELGWKPPAKEADAVSALQLSSRFIEKELLPLSTRFPDEQRWLVSKFMDKVGGNERFAARKMLRERGYLKDDPEGDWSEDDPPVVWLDPTPIRFIWILLSSQRALLLLPIITVIGIQWRRKGTTISALWLLGMITLVAITGTLGAEMSIVQSNLLWANWLALTPGRSLL